MTVEPGRPSVNFGVQIVIAAVATIGQLQLAYALQDVYDVAVNSLDFGSGFLSTEEVENLRLIGKAIGADPLHYKCHTGNFGKKRECSCGALS